MVITDDCWRTSVLDQFPHIYPGREVGRNILCSDHSALRSDSLEPCHRWQMYREMRNGQRHEYIIFLFWVHYVGYVLDINRKTVCKPSGPWTEMGITGCGWLTWGIIRYRRPGCLHATWQRQLNHCSGEAIGSSSSASTASGHTPDTWWALGSRRR